MLSNGIFIGRFQPLHDGHLANIRAAAAQSKTLLILIGSANSCRTIKNPWTYQERKDLLMKKIFQMGLTNVKILPLNDYLYNDSLWIRDVIETTAHVFGNDRVNIWGHFKEGNDYLNWFPQFSFKSLPTAAEGISSTKIRELMFETSDPAMPADVMADWQYYKKERVLFENYPFPETLNFNCADSVVVCLGHVLLIERKHAPGRNSWAVPGGFRNQRETFKECSLRELREETNLRVPEKVLLGSIRGTKLYDDPRRSFGIPRNTVAFYYVIEPDRDGSLPRANGMDDAKSAVWVPLDKAMKMPLYDDHKSIISDFTGVYETPAYMTL